MVALPYTEAQAASSTKIAPKHLSPRRVTITVPYALYCELLARSDQQGRSLSNLAAFLLVKRLSPVLEFFAEASVPVFDFDPLIRKAHEGCPQGNHYSLGAIPGL